MARTRPHITIFLQKVMQFLPLVTFNKSKCAHIFTMEYEARYNYTHSQPPTQTEVWGHFHVAVALLQQRGHHLHNGEETVWGKSWSGRLLEGNNIFPLPVIKLNAMVRPIRSLVPLPAMVTQLLLLEHCRTEMSFHIRTQYQISSRTYLCNYLFIQSFLRNCPLNDLLT